MSGGSTEEQKIAAAVQRAQLLGLQDRETEALDVLAEALVAAPDSDELLANRAWLYNRLDRPRAAVESAEAALRIQPYNATALFQIVNAHLQQNDFAEAEQALMRMLELWPEDAEVHRQLAITIAVPYDGSAGRRLLREKEHQRRRDLAYTHFQKALQIAPEDPDCFETAARVCSILSIEQTQALSYADQGLALAPEHLGLLQIRSVILEEVTAAAQERGSRRASHVVAVVEADRILRLDPGNSSARMRMFEFFWKYCSSVVDAPLIGLAFIMFTIATLFVDDGTVTLFFPVLTLAAFIVIVRVVRYVRIASKVNPAFRRSVLFGSRRARLGIALSGVAWTTMIVGGFSLPFVRDAVLLRRFIVAVTIAVFVALVASLLWQLSYSEVWYRSGGGSDSARGFRATTAHRFRLLFQVFLRGVLGAAALLLMGTNLRDDARSMTYLAFAALLLPPLVGMIKTGVAERRRLAALPDDSAVRTTHRGPKKSRLVTVGVAAVLVVAVLAINVVHLPVAPNEYDAIGRYEVPVREPREPAVEPKNPIPTYTPIDLEVFDEFDDFTELGPLPTVVPVP